MIGNGVVIDPAALVREMEILSAQGVAVSPENLMISTAAPIILPVHQQVDLAREKRRGAGKIGTTGRGIGPAYEDKVARRGLRMADLLDKDALAEKTAALLEHHNVWLEAAGEAALTPDAILEPLMPLAEQLIPYLGEVWDTLDAARRKGRRVLFEGAQGVMLDIDHGTYPFVTSSNTVPGQAAAGAGVGPGAVGYVLGITKAIPPVSVPGRSRRKILAMTATAWVNVAVSLGQSQAANAVVAGSMQSWCARQVRSPVLTGWHSPSSMCLTVLTLRICTAYRLDGVEINRFPAAAAEQARVEPVYEEIEGWHESTMGARSWADLPPSAVKYIKRVEELTGIPWQQFQPAPNVRTPSSSVIRLRAKNHLN